jgi:hypothetical protein
MRAGLTIATHHGRPVVCGPIGTEQLALQLAAALEAAERSSDGPYAFGGRRPNSRQAGAVHTSPVRAPRRAPRALRVDHTG